MIDCTNGEIYVLEVLNCNLLQLNCDCHTKQLLELCELYNLSQVINEPTRVTQHSETLLDLCLTTTPEKISCSGVIRSGKSDHDIVFMVRKLNSFRIKRHRTIQKRCLKHFKRELFIKDLENIPWEDIKNANPNREWENWKALFLSIVDKHAPLKKRRVRNKRSPWLTRGIVYH